MSDKDANRTLPVFICTTGTDYISIRCKTCGEPWMFNKSLTPPIKMAVEGEWKCPYCKRGYYRATGKD